MEKGGGDKKEAALDPGEAGGDDMDTVADAAEQREVTEELTDAGVTDIDIVPADQVPTDASLVNVHTDGDIDGEGDDFSPGKIALVFGGLAVVACVAVSAWNAIPKLRALLSGRMGPMELLRCERDAIGCAYEEGNRNGGRRVASGVVAAKKWILAFPGRIAGLLSRKKVDEE